MLRYRNGSRCWVYPHADGRQCRYLSGPKRLDTLQLQAAAENIDLIARGTLSGVVHGLLYQPSSNNYLSDTGATYTQASYRLWFWLATR